MEITCILLAFVKYKNASIYLLKRKLGLRATVYLDNTPRLGCLWVVPAHHERTGISPTSTSKRPQTLMHKRSTRAHALLFPRFEVQTQESKVKSRLGPIAAPQKAN